MKKILTALCLSAVMPLTALAQHEEETENGIVSLAGSCLLYTSPSPRDA